jgi:hypothetical protein
MGSNSYPRLVASDATTTRRFDRQCRRDRRRRLRLMAYGQSLLRLESPSWSCVNETDRVGPGPVIRTT